MAKTLRLNLTVAVLVAVIGASVDMVAQPALADPAAGATCSQPISSTNLIKEPSWAQQLYAPATALWPLSRGSGITVAVIDTGVSNTHPQLTKAVDVGTDELSGVANGNVDCSGHGTGVASIIAAAQIKGVGMYGMAPDARILPVRVSETLTAATPGVPDPSPDRIAAGISFALSQKANVIVVSAPTTGDSVALKQATTAALSAGVPIVGAVGDQQPPPSDNGSLSDAPASLTPYPTALEGVIGVAAIDQSGARVANSQIGSYVDLAAPGASLVVGGSGAGQDVVSGTSFAAAFVGATIALMLAEPANRYRSLTGPKKVAAITEQLTISADTLGPAGGPNQTGAGMLDPLRALSEKTQPPGASAPPATYSEPTIAAAQAQAAAAERSARFGSNVAVIIVVGALIVIVVGLSAWRRGRGRRFRPVAAPAISEPDSTEEFVPGDALFAPPPDP